MKITAAFKYEKEFSGNSNTKKRKLQHYREITGYLYHNKSASTSEIARHTKLSQPSVAQLIKELIKFGIVTSNGIGASIGGRKPNIYCINSNYQFVIGVDININTIRLALFDLNNEIIAFEEYTDHYLKNTLKYLEDLIEKVNQLIVHTKTTPDQIIALGISIAGLVDSKKGETYTHLNFLKEPIADYLERRVHIPVLIDNDARIMAMGEKEFGKAQNKKDVLCLNLSEGIGLGIILNRQLYSGKNGFAGEFGHIMVDSCGKLCYCGKMGCLETIASGDVLIKDIEQAIQQGQASLLSHIKKNDAPIIISDIVEAVKQGDQFVISKLTEQSEILGRGLVTLIHLFNPEMIIIGGKLAHAGKYITDPINMALNKHAMDRIRIETEIVCSDFPDKSALLGTMANVMDILLSADSYRSKE